MRVTMEQFFETPFFIHIKDDVQLSAIAHEVCQRDDRYDFEHIMNYPVPSWIIWNYKGFGCLGYTMDEAFMTMTNYAHYDFLDIEDLININKNELIALIGE